MPWLGMSAEMLETWNRSESVREEYLDVVRATEEFPITIGALVRGYRTGKLAYKIVGRKYLFRRTDIQKFVESQPGDHENRKNPAAKY